MATNRPDTLDPALMRPGRLDRKVEFGLPDLEGRTHIFKIHARSMSVEKDIRYELLARLCPNSTGELASDETVSRFVDVFTVLGFGCLTFPSRSRCFCGLRNLSAGEIPKRGLCFQ